MFKKISILGLVSVLAILILTSCNNSNLCKHTFGDWKVIDEPTCTSSGHKVRTCEKCGEVETENISQLGHTTQAGTCSRCGESFGIWRTNYYVDEFKNPTNYAYVTASVSGTFSNTATTDSKLTVKFIVDASEFTIKLLEYGTHEVKSTGFESYAITLLDTNNVKHYLHGLMQENGNGIEITGDDKEEVIKAFQQQGQISFYIQETNRPTTNYLFTVETSNFINVYNTVCGEIDNKIDYIEENPVTLRIGICPLPEEDNPYVNELGGMIYGFDIDYIKTIAYQLGYTDDKIKFSINTFDELFNGLDSDKYDIIISAIEYTEERKKDYSTSDIYLKNKDGNFAIYSSAERLPLIEKINAEIENLDNAGTTATLIEKWFDNP